MTKTDLARQLLSLIQNEGLIKSFDLQEDGISVNIEDKEIRLNLDQPLSQESETNLIRDFKTTRPIFNEETGEFYFDVNLKFYPQIVANPTSLNGIGDSCYIIGNQFHQEMNRCFQIDA